MLYQLLTYLDKKFALPGFGVFKYVTFRAGAAAITALVIAFWLGPKIIRMLRAHQIGEAAKLEAPKTHLSKAGTPTMGGLIIILAIIIPTLLLANLNKVYIRLMLISTVWLGIIGFIDDYLKGQQQNLLDFDNRRQEKLKGRKP